jgi:hypothetical protein
MPVLFAAQWMDESSPLLAARIEDVTWNVDVSEYIQQEGPKLRKIPQIEFDLGDYCLFKGFQSLEIGC